MIQLERSACPKCRERGNDNRGDNLIRYSNGHSHCFACRYHVYPKHFTPLAPKPTSRNKELLPFDYDETVPAAAWQWLIQYGLSFQYWRQQVGYSESSKRLVFKVGSPLAFSIGRYIPASDSNVSETAGPGDGVALLAEERSMDAGSGRSSTVFAKPTKWKTYGDSHKHAEIIQAHSDADHTKTTVLTEDLISAHKVGQLTQAMPLFGTQVHPCHLYHLNNIDNRVVLWLDKDQEGLVKGKALRLESLINRPVEIILTDKDPKSLPFNMIKGILGV